MTSNTSILSLPPELKLSIGDFLPRDSIIALKLAHRDFDYALPTPQYAKHEIVGRCERLFTLSTLSRDASRHRCVLCKAIYDVRFFDPVGSPADVPRSVLFAAQQADHVPYPSGLCWREVGRFVKIIRTEAGGKTGWTSQKDVVCTHCGSVQGWNSCDCACNSCPRQLVRTYTHHVNE